MKSKILLFVGMMLTTGTVYSNVNLTHTQNIIRKNNGLFLLMGEKEYLVDTNTITIKYNQKSLKAINTLKILRSNSLGYIDIAIHDSIDVEEYVNQIKKIEGIESVEYNTMGEYNFIPNDSQLNYQWHLNRINMFKAWDITLGKAIVKVAVLDSGVDTNHFDIGYGTDGYTNFDLSNAWNYVTNSNNVITTNSHGTFVSGIIGAKTANNTGIAGISGGNNSEGVKVIPYCVGVSTPQSAILDDAIIDAVNKGVKVINLSLSVGPSTAINSAIEYAYNHNVTIVCSSGNDSSAVKYPASHEHTIAVGAINAYDSRTYFSNYGVGLDIVAPGQEMYSTALNNTFVYWDGTSFSAPQVTGVVALMLSVNPGLTPLQIKNIITNTAEKLSAYTYDNNGWNQEVGYGVLDAYKAILNVIKINGSDKIYNSDVYSLNTSNLPNIYSVSWTLSGDNASCFTVQNDTPATGKCTITRKNNVEFSGSTSLTLTAQISYNGTVVRTLTKPVTAFYISGDPNPCSTEIYSVEDLPSNYTVTWDLSGLGYSVLSDVIPEGAQNNNYFGVQRTSQNSYASATVTATLWSGNDEVGVLEKRIWSGAGFTGTWYPSSSQSAPYLPDSTASELQCEIYTVEPNKTIVLQSNDFIGALMTCNNGNVSISHPFNSSTATFYTNTANGYSFTVEGTKLGTCKVFRFKFLAVGAPEPDEPLMLGISATGHDYVFSLTEKQENTEEQQAARTIRNWKLTILHSETGQAIYEGLAESDAITVNTSGWKPGIYVAVANVNGKNIAQKLSVTR